MIGGADSHFSDSPTPAKPFRRNKSSIFFRIAFIPGILPRKKYCSCLIGATTSPPLCRDPAATSPTRSEHVAAFTGARRGEIRGLRCKLLARTTNEERHNDTRSQLRFLLFSIVCGLAAPSTGSQVTPPAQIPLSVEISAPSREVKAGSEFKLDVVMTNTSDEPVSLSFYPRGF
jgi:hypothetical protein